MRRFHGRDSAVWMDGKVEPLAVLGPLLVQTGRVVVLMPHQIEVLAHQHLEHTWRHHAMARALHQLAVTQRTRDCLSGGTKHQSSVLPLAKNLTTLLKRPADGILLQWGRKRQRRLLAAAYGRGVGKHKTARIVLVYQHELLNRVLAACSSCLDEHLDDVLILALLREVQCRLAPCA